MDQLAITNQKRWNDMHIPAENGPKFKEVADRLTAFKGKYQAIEKMTGVPWWFIAVVHQRESGGRWDRNLANGQPLSQRTTIVPVGRGPFKTWEDGAVDALVNCPPFASRNKDWSVGGALALLERYNGLGYANKGVPSPYIWGGTDQYDTGKFVRDHEYDPNFRDPQLGCAGMLKFMNVFRTGLHSTTTAAGAVVVGGAITAAASPHHHWPWIIAITAVLAIGIFFGYAYYEFQKVKNVSAVRS